MFMNDVKDVSMKQGAQGVVRVARTKQLIPDPGMEHRLAYLSNGA